MENFARRVETRRGRSREFDIQDEWPGRGQPERCSDGRASTVSCRAPRRVPSLPLQRALWREPHGPSLYEHGVLPLRVPLRYGALRHA
jgi:hypothetical protein